MVSNMPTNKTVFLHTINAIILVHFGRGCLDGSDLRNTLQAGCVLEIRYLSTQWAFSLRNLFIQQFGAAVAVPTLPS